MPTMHPSDPWTTLANCVQPFGWTGAQARRWFRQVGLLDKAGKPHEKLLECTLVKREKNRWQWNRVLVEGLFDEMGAARLTPIEQKARHAVGEFLANIRRHRKAQAAGNKEASIYLVAASSALMSARPAPHDPDRMEKLLALGREMHLGGIDDGFQETLWASLKEDGTTIMGLVQKTFLVENTPAATRSRRAGRL